MLDTIRPRLADGARLRRRSDGSWGVANPESGRAVELAPDQDTLIGLIDGERNLAQIAEVHLAQHRFVPFSALRDLLRSLSAAGILAHSRAELHRAKVYAQPNWMQRLGLQVLTALPVPPRPWFAPILSTLALVIAVWTFTGPHRALGAWDLALAYLGASVALTFRSLFKAEVAAFSGEPPRRVYLASGFGVLHLALDNTGTALLDRGPRALSHLAALIGAGVAVFGAWGLPGPLMGAAAVLVVDLCPFAPTSFGKLLATLAGRVDLREHARAYLSRRLLRRIGSSDFFSGEGSLILSTLLSLAWLGMVVRLLLTLGSVRVLEFLALAVDAQGAEKALATAGAAVVAVLIPVSLLALGAAVVRAGLSLLPRAQTSGGEQTRPALEAADLARIPLFSQVAPRELAAIAQAARELKFKPGQRIVGQGEPGDAFFALGQGEVAVQLEDPSGLVREIAHLGPGDCFGETALLEQRPRTATVRAVTEVVVLQLARDAFDRVRHSVGDGGITQILRATAALHRSALFGALSPERLSALALKLSRREAAQGQVLVQEGESGHEFFLVSSGALEVVDAQGSAVTQLGPGDHFGEIALLRDVPRTATVRATAPAELLVLDKAEFIGAMAADLSLSTRLEEIAGERAESGR
ncbi:MAG: cyclic nucleotide-binding domain-containing protein [Myxococcota bacterium]|nr:cyclic nucleotide-binding domain-containing protein [Myxococcota bacterium]